MKAQPKAFALLMTLCVVGELSPREPQAQHELRAASRLARDGDLQADWNTVLDARAKLERLVQNKEIAALAHYHLGYLDWRLSSLVYISLGPRGPIPYWQRSIRELEQAVALKPDLSDAHALIGMLSGALIGTDPTQSQALLPRLQSAWKASAEAGQAGNPRALLIKAMTLFASPPEYGGSREKGIALWQEAIALFEKERDQERDPLTPEWGHAEAWGWLGGAYLQNGEPDKAVTAFNRALELRKDFWWVAQIALPQARRPALAKPLQ
jgi:tetratricopeptide (TPR) repeat protein